MAVEDEAEIRVFVVDREGNRFGKGPIGDAKVSSFTDVLNGTDTATISFDPLARNAQHLKLLKREVQIWFDDELAWWGVPWRMSGPLSECTVECEGLDSLLKMRTVDDASLLYTSIDQLSIGWSLVDYAQSELTQANRDLNISSAAFAPSGKLRSRTYDRWQHPFIFDLMQEWHTLVDGFEWKILYDATGARLWTPGYPKRGTLKNSFKLVLNEQKVRGVESFEYSEDATAIITEAYITGGSSGDIKFEGHYEDTAASAEFGVVQGVISEGSESDVDWLDEKAEKTVTDRKRTIIAPTVGVTRVPIEFFGNVKAGDSIPVKVDYGIYQVDDVYRIGKVEWTPDAVLVEFAEKVTV